MMFTIDSTIRDGVRDLAQEQISRHAGVVIPSSTALRGVRETIGIIFTLANASP